MVRETLADAWRAVVNAGISGSDARDLMLEALAAIADEDQTPLLQYNLSCYRCLCGEEAEAKRILREQGLNEKQMRGKIDMIAASLFLQTWLDRKNEEVSHA